jgi:hypothetical protein
MTFTGDWNDLIGNAADERYKVYRQKIDEIESDPEAPQGLAALVSRAVVRTAYIGGDLLPGVRKGLEYFPREAVETQASEWLLIW